MVEMEGKAFLTRVFDKLYEQLASLMVDSGTNSEGLKPKMLEQKLKEVSMYLDDAEDWQIFDKKVKEWLDDLMHVVFMADDLVEQINDSEEEKNLKRKDVDFSKSVYDSLAKTEGEIDLILTDLEGLLERAIVLELKRVSSRSSPIIVAPSREEHHIYGREAEKEEILKTLLSEEDKIIVLPIVGMAGLGKTTLAQLVYNDKRVEEHGFSLKAWVTISTKFDICRIMNEILQKFNPGPSCSNVNDINELHELMKEILRGKRFLFVLDNVWDKDYINWDILMSNFRAGDPRSRVIVTTRSRDVGYMMWPIIYELKEVQKDDCWSIFVHHAFNGDTNADPRLQAIGRRIVENCRALPLAIRFLGSLLCSERNPQKWENILRSNFGDWSKVMENGVLPSLWLSYRDLSSSLKQCFAYCSLFRQDYKFKKNEMAMWWMAEGFICSNEEDKSMEETGEEYFDDLISRSLFQTSSDDDGWYVVHNLVHDLATFVYGKFCFKRGYDLETVTVRTRHLTYNKDVSSDDFLNFLSTSNHLRTLMDLEGGYRRVHEHDFVKEIKPKVWYLRVLTLIVPAWHHSLGDLKMLRYLNLSESCIRELPDSICSLFHLQTLILRDCSNITQLPTDLPRKLNKLRHLDTSGTRLTMMPPEMGSLQELRVLRQFILCEGDGSGCSTLKELGELHHLGGHLGIFQLQNVDNLEDVENANLRDKAEMKALCLEWSVLGDTGDMIDKAIDVLDALQPHNNLEKLDLCNYPGSSFPKWVGERSFSKMVYVFLNGGRSSALPPLGQLPSLRELHIIYFKWVEKIGNEVLYDDDNSSITPFPSLEKLEFYYMKKWKEWSFVGNDSGCFPRLKQLTIHHCRKLECINREDERAEMDSTKLHHRCPSLSQLKIVDCDLLERRYQRYKGDQWHYISHIPNVEIVGFTTDKLNRKEEETRRGKEKFVSQIPEIHKTGSTTLNDDLEMGDRAVLVMVFEKLIEQLASPELRTSSFSSKLKMLEEKLEKVKLYMDDREGRKLSDEDVKEWLDELKHVVFVADDLVEQINNSKVEKSPKWKDDDSVEFFKSVYHSLAKTVQGKIDLILTDLEGLYDRAPDFELKHISTSTVQKMESLKELHPLGGKLRISQLQNVENLEDVQKASLRDEVEMKELYLEWEDNNTSSMIPAVDVLDALKPHKRLEKLSVYGYPGSSFPNWVGEGSFSELASVELEGGRSHFLPPLGQLPSLRELRIECFKGVEKIGKELLYGIDTNSSITPFPCLETLSFHNMTRWKEWSFDGSESRCFPRLRSLDIQICPKLESIISIGPGMESTKVDQHWPSLSELTIFECPLLGKRYQKYKGDHWHYISHIPDIHITGSVTTGTYDRNIW